MGKEIRTVCFDSELMVEAYQFEGIMQRFPNHFHDDYVIGFVEKGQRLLSCKNRHYQINPGDLVVFNPGDNHTCEQADNETLDYRCINITPEIMRETVFEITGKEYLPNYLQNVLVQSELAICLRDLHQMLLNEEKDFRKEEKFMFLIDSSLEQSTDGNSLVTVTESNAALKIVCEYLEENYANNITLQDLVGLIGLNKYSLIRSFTREKGITPYYYLETIRVSKAKKLLEKGLMPVDVAFQTGFYDQSHFTNCFKKYLGVTPRYYGQIFKRRLKE